MKIFQSLLELFQTPKPPPPPIEKTDADLSNNSHVVRCKVFACLEAGYLHVQVGLGSGLLSNASLRPIEVAHLPLNCRMPNTIIEITFDKNWDVLKIVLAK